MARIQSEPGPFDLAANDIWIAACASVTGALLVTVDTDFVHLVGHLNFERYDPSSGALVDKFPA